MWAAIMSVFTMINSFIWLIKQIISIWKEVDAQAAAAKRKRLDEALNRLEKAKTPEEQSEAIKDVTRNSF